MSLSLLNLGVAGMGVVKDVADSYGSLSDEVVVTVHGSPAADKNDLWALAASTAFGLARRWTGKLWGVSPPPGVIMLDHNLEVNSVTFTLRYERSLAAIFAVRPNNFDSWLESLPVLAGPMQTNPDGTPIGGYLGGAWDFVVAGDAPDLPFAGRPVLWWDDLCPTAVDPTLPPEAGGATVLSPNPRPYGDLRSRGTLVEMVFAALSNPGSGYLMNFDRPATMDAGHIGG